MKAPHCYSAEKSTTSPSAPSHRPNRAAHCVFCMAADRLIELVGWQAGRLTGCQAEAESYRITTSAQCPCPYLTSLAITIPLYVYTIQHTAYTLIYYCYSFYCYRRLYPGRIVEAQAILSVYYFLLGLFFCPLLSISGRIYTLFSWGMMFNAKERKTLFIIPI